MIPAEPLGDMHDVDCGHRAQQLDGEVMCGDPMPAVPYVNGRVRCFRVRDEFLQRIAPAMLEFTVNPNGIVAASGNLLEVLDRSYGSLAPMPAA